MIHRSEQAASMARAFSYAGGLFGDLKVAIRSLRRVPSFWATIALTLALGIGMNTAIFSVVRGVLLRPLMNRDEDRLIYIQQSAPGLQVSNATFSIPEVTDIGAHLKTISKLGTFSTIDFSADGFGEAREIHAGVVDGAYFDVMGLKPVLGRLLDERDDGPNAPGAVVLTYKFWATRAAFRSERDWKVYTAGQHDGSPFGNCRRSFGAVRALSGGNATHRQHRHQPAPSFGNHGAGSRASHDRHIRPLGAWGEPEFRACRTSHRVRNHDGGPS